MYTSVHSDVAWESGVHQTTTTLLSKFKFFDLVITSSWLFYIVECKPWGVSVSVVRYTNCLNHINQIVLYE